MKVESYEEKDLRIRKQSNCCSVVEESGNTFHDLFELFSSFRPLAATIKLLITIPHKIGKSNKFCLCESSSHFEQTNDRR